MNKTTDGQETPKEEKKEVNDFDGLEGDDLHDAMRSQADEEVQAEKDGRDPKRVLDKQDENLDSEDEDGNSDKSDEQDDDDAGTDDDEDDNANDDSDSDEDEEDSDAGEEGDEDDLDKEISEYAEKEGLNYADAKEDLEKITRIVEQYSNDPKKMAKAMREKDREYQKLRVEKEKAEKKEPPFVRKSDEQFVSEVKSLLANPKDEDLDEEGNLPIITNFRNKWPARSESMSDEAIIENIADDALGQYKTMAATKEAEINTTASTRRDEFISALPKEDRRFIPEIKAILSKTDTFTLADEDFNFKDIVDLIKGRAYDADIKAAEDRGSKRGSEKPRINGLRGTKGGSNNGGRKGEASVSLNEKQKKRAVEMFGTNQEDDVCYEMYIDTWGDRIKKEPNFV